MRIASLRTRLSPDSTQLYFSAIATAAVPADATAAVLLEYTYHPPQTPEGQTPPKKTDEEKAYEKANDGKILTIEKPLQGISIEGNRLEGFVNVAEISATLIENYLFKASFSTVAVKLEPAGLVDNPVQAPDVKLPESDDEPTNTKVHRIWNHYEENYGSRQFWVSSAYLDLDNAVTIEAAVTDKYIFPGVMAPQQIKENDFNALLVSSSADLVEKNGKVYMIETPTGLKRIGILFSNQKRTYAQYLSSSQVYQFSVPGAMAFTRPIQSQDLVKVKDKTFTFDVDVIEMDSANFYTDIYTILSEFNTLDVNFDRRTFDDLDLRENPNFNVINSGTTNTSLR